MKGSRTKAAVAGLLAVIALTAGLAAMQGDAQGSAGTN
jgi:hypothetical protein